MLDKRLKFVLPSKPESLEAIRHEVGIFVSGTVFANRSKDILLVASEAGTNVVRHAYNDKRVEQLITIECILCVGTLTVLVCDKGRGLSRAKSRILFSEEGGFGLYLMKELTDKFKCHSSRFGTVVELGFESGEGKKRKLFKPIRIVSPRTMKSYSKIKAFTLFVTERTRELESALGVNDYDLANVILRKLQQQFVVTNRSFCRLTPITSGRVKNWLESNIVDLRKLELSLIESEVTEMSEIICGSGIYDMIRQRETINLLSALINDLDAALNDKDGCWLALDDGPLQLI